MHEIVNNIWQTQMKDGTKLIIEMGSQICKKVAVFDLNLNFKFFLSKNPKSTRNGNNETNSAAV